jgi:hypothetical protein
MGVTDRLQMVTCTLELQLVRYYTLSLYPVRQKKTIQNSYMLLARAQPLLNPVEELSGS